MKKWISEHIGYIVYGCFVFILSCITAGFAGHHSIQQVGCSDSIDAIMNTGGLGIIAFVTSSIVFGALVPIIFFDICKRIKEQGTKKSFKIASKSILKDSLLGIKVFGVFFLVFSFIAGLIWLSGKLLQLIFC